MDTKIARNKMDISNIQKIDVHTHILPPNIPKFKDKFGYGGFIHLDHDHQNCCANMVRDDGFFFRKHRTPLPKPLKTLYNNP